MKKNTSLSTNQAGIISIAVTLIVTTLLSLMVIGFSRLALRENRQVLDQQLNTQAFYAAESGVNFAINEVITNPSYDGNCNNSGPNNDPEPLSAGSAAAVSCIIVNREPTVLEYSDVGTDGSIVIPINSPSQIDSLTISWQAKSGEAVFPPASDCDRKLTPANEWNNKTPVINAMLIPTQFADRNDLINRTQKIMLYPGVGCAGGSPYAAAFNNFTEQGRFVSGNCSTTTSVTQPRYCNVTITGINAINGGNNSYVLRLKSIYGPATVSVLANGGNIALTNAQNEIDVTGRAADVVRRVKANVPSQGNIYANKIYPEFAVESVDGMCKRLIVTPGQSPSASVSTPGNPAGICDIN